MNPRIILILIWKTCAQFKSTSWSFSNLPVFCVSSHLSLMNSLQPMVSSRLGSPLVSSRALFSACLSTVCGRSLRRSWNGFVSADPICFYNLLSSFRRRRCEAIDAIALGGVRGSARARARVLTAWLQVTTEGSVGQKFTEIVRSRPCPRTRNWPFSRKIFR